MSLRGCQPKFQTYLALQSNAHKYTLLSKANESAEGVSGLILCLPWPSVVCQHRHCGMHVCSWFSGFCWGMVPSRQPFDSAPFFQEQSMMPEVRDLSDALPELPMDPITGVGVLASRSRAPTGYDVVSRALPAAALQALVLHY